MDPKNNKEKVLAAYKLISENPTGREKFNHITTLLKGIHPEIDKKIEIANKALSDFEKIQQGELIELSIENLPETTDEEKERKRLLLLFIKTWKDLQNEVERVKNEFENINRQQSKSESVKSAGKIIAYAKGPFGIITIGAVIIAATLLILTQNQPKKESPLPKQSKKIKVLLFNDKKIPLSELISSTGPECDQDEHYHAINHEEAKSLDGETIQDPGNCGFGKVNEVRIEEIYNPNP